MTSDDTADSTLGLQDNLGWASITVIILSAEGITCVTHEFDDPAHACCGRPSRVRRVVSEVAGAFAAHSARTPAIATSTRYSRTACVP